MDTEEKQTELVTEAGQSKTEKTTKPKSGLKYIKLFVFFLVIILIAALAFALVNFINNTSKIISIAEDPYCLGEQTCIQIDGKYNDGWATWKAVSFLPAFFSITTTGFSNEQNVKIICPTDAITLDNSIGTKLQFIFNNPDIQKCRVHV